MCLRHGDFHAMSQDCWALTTEWYFEHQHLGDQGSRDAYLAAVEQQMLDNLIRSHR
ncbi:hypothetical protein ACWC4D_33870 [Streptomyces sp. NPDC001288]